MYVIAYTGDTDDGFLKTVQIAGSGEIGNEEIDSFEFDVVKGKTPDIIPISGDVYAIAYAEDGDDRQRRSDYGSHNRLRRVR